MIRLFTFFYLFSFFYVNAQQVDVPFGNPSGTGSGTATFRKPLGTTRSYERTSLIYLHSEIGAQGTIQSLGFFVDSLNVPGDAITRVFIKEVSDSVFAAPSAFAPEINGATLVFDDTIPAALFIDSTWIVINLTTPFVHQTTQNIKVIVETNSGGTNGTDANLVSKGFRYFTTTLNRFQYWQSPANNGTPPAGNGTLSPLRPNIRFEILPLPQCTTPPNAGTAIANNDSLCAGQTLSISLSGQDIGAGISYQWISSLDGINFSAMTNDTLVSLSTTVSASTFFACILSCSGTSDTSNIVSVNVLPFYQCYCTQNIGGDCTNAIDSIAIQNTTLQNGLSGCSGAYTLWPAGGNTTAQLVQGLPYTISGKFTTNARVSVWIDFDQNGIFDNNEWTQVATTTVPGQEYSAVIAVDPAALTGLTGMRVRSRATAGQNDSTSACATFGTGETEDYVIEILASQACIAPPDAGSVLPSADSVCAGESINFTLAGNTTGSGLSYQWLISSDAQNWIADINAVSSVYNLVVDSAVYVTCVTTCSGVSDTAQFSQISIKPFIECYCTNALGGNCATTAIDSVAIEFSTLNNGLTGCSAGNYVAYPNSGNTTATLFQGVTHQLITRYTGNVRAGVWIDYDHSGTFDVAEFTNITNNVAGNTDITASITIPATALTGLTAMRIRSRGVTGQLDGTVSCATFGSGETEDYLISISPAPPCTNPPDAGVLSVTSDSVCTGDSVSFILTGSGIGTGLSFQWISSPDAQTWTDISGATSTSYGQVISDASYFACVALCQGSADTSNVVFVFVNDFLDCYCTAGLGGNCVASAIDSLAFAGTSFVNPNSGCAVGNYTLYPDTGNLSLTMDVGQLYDLRARFNGDVRAVVWVDFDQNGVYDFYEGTQICTTSAVGAEVSVSVLVPLGALPGITGMRVRSRVTAGVNDSTSACDAFGTGETEDYRVLINAGPTGLTSGQISRISVAPNPAHDIIMLNGLQQGDEFVLTDISGKLIMMQRIFINGVHEVSLKGVSPGLYFLSVKNPADGVVHSLRIIKQ